MHFPKAVYNILPSSRPVSAERQLTQPPESVVSDQFLKPHNLEEAQLRRQSSWWVGNIWPLFERDNFNYALTGFPWILSHFF